MSVGGALYRGSPKHKNRPARGRKGSLCPEWTHTAGNHRLRDDVFRHEWPATEAHGLFSTSEEDPAGTGKRYATGRGIAFVAQSSGDGTWHGYPEPWNKVPAILKERWLEEGRVSARDLKRYSDFPSPNIHWALKSDDD